MKSVATSQIAVRSMGERCSTGGRFLKKKLRVARGLGGDESAIVTSGMSLGEAIAMSGG